MEKIATLVQEKKLSGVSDLRNESSDRNGIRLVIELKRDAVPQVVLNALFKQTQLEDTFSVNSVGLVDGVPRVLSLPELIKYYIELTDYFFIFPIIVPTIIYCSSITSH